MKSIKAQFFGREAILRDLVQGVLAGSLPLDFSLVGPNRIGKSRLLKYLAAEHGPLKGPDFADWRPTQFQDGQNVFVAHYNCDWPDAQQHLTQFISRQIQAQMERENLPFSVDESASPGQQIGQMVRHLEQQGIRLVLILDNFDHILRQGKVTEAMTNELRPLTLELGLIVSTETPLHDLSRSEFASPLFNVMHQLFVGLLTPTASADWLDTYAQGVPMSAEVKAELAKLTGGHPFLLARINDLLLELEPLVAHIPVLTLDHLPLPIIRLRLAEHGRPLFESIWRRLQQDTKGKTAMPLVEQLVTTPIVVGQVPADQIFSLNWLINQTIVKFDDNNYRLFSPLLESFLAEKLNLCGAPAPDAAPQHTPNLLQTLAPKEARLFSYFQKNSNVPITFEQLLTDVWQQPADASPRRVQEAIRRLRNSLRKQSPPPGTIKSERGVGYRFVPHQNNN